MDLKIKNVDKEDLDKFVEVYKSAYKKLGKYAYWRKRDIRWYFKWLLKRDANGFFKAEIDGEAIAFVACDSNWHGLYEKVGEIHEIVVKEEYKGKGIGRNLMEVAEEYLKSKGHKIIELWVGEENYVARKFYEKLGYKARDKFGVWIRMVKRLAD